MSSDEYTQALLDVLELDFVKDYPRLSDAQLMRSLGAPTFDAAADVLISAPVEDEHECTIVTDYLPGDYAEGDEYFGEDPGFGWHSDYR